MWNRIKHFGHFLMDYRNDSNEFRLLDKRRKKGIKFHKNYEKSADNKNSCLMRIYLNCH